MKSSTVRIDSHAIATERESIVRAGRMHWVHWLIVLASLLLTFMAWYFSRNQLEEKAEARFDREADQAIELIKERMELYENVLWSGVSAIKANSGDISPLEWRAFSSSLRVHERYPGINGIGLIDHLPAAALDDYVANERKDRPDFRVHPEHSEKMLWPIRIIEPLAANAKAVGLDIAHETNRRTGAERSRDTGLARITGPIVLVQDSGQTAGFLFYAPYYTNAESVTIEDRRKNIAGLIYAPFIVNELMAGTLRKETRHVGIRISDGDQLIYDEHVDTEEDYDATPLYSKMFSHGLYGRQWHFDIRSARSFRGAATTGQPTLILLGGIFIDSLLLTMFVLLSRSNRRAVEFADGMTNVLLEQTKELQRSNEDLEKFAYVASHDLKTPLRGIGDLAEYLEEDLEDYLSAEGTNPDIRKNLARLNVQVGRMDNLIKGVLEYSSVGSGKRTIEEVDMIDLIGTTVRDSGLGDEHWEFKGSPATFQTCSVQFSQVLVNLISNAVKYHDDPDRAMITLAIQDAGEEYEVSISDNGPGIDPRYHERIFEVFQTLQSKDVVESTGIGLAIVKKTVEGVGGTVGVRSEVGIGTTFTFTWPQTVEALEESRGDH